MIHLVMIVEAGLGNDTFGDDCGAIQEMVVIHLVMTEEMAI